MADLDKIARESSAEAESLFARVKSRQTTVGKSPDSFAVLFRKWQDSAKRSRRLEIELERAQNALQISLINTRMAEDLLLAGDFSE